MRIAVQFGLRFSAQGGVQFNFQAIFPEMCLQGAVIGVRRIIKTPNPSFADRARNRTAIRTHNQTCIESPLMDRIH
jgi:hypothetical protein